MADPKDERLREMARRAAPRLSARISEIEDEVDEVAQPLGWMRQVRTAGVAAGILTWLPQITRRFAILPMCIGLTAQHFIMKREDQIQVLELERRETIADQEERLWHLTHQVLSDMPVDHRHELADILEALRNRAPAPVRQAMGSPPPPSPPLTASSEP